MATSRAVFKKMAAAERKWEREELPKIQAEKFNQRHAVGTQVKYWTGARVGEGKVSTTRSIAQVLGGHTAVVWVEGYSSCIALTHIEPLPTHAEKIIDESIAMVAEAEKRAK